jgi:hypothetical protein
LGYQFESAEARPQSHNTTEHYAKIIGGKPEKLRVTIRNPKIKLIVFVAVPFAVLMPL